MTAGRFEKFLGLFILFFWLSLFITPDSRAQQTTGARIEELRQRVMALENNFQKLQSGITDFSKALVANVDQQLMTAKTRAVVINPLSRKVSRVDTNIGTFLLAVSRMDKIDDGYRLYLQIGNPNAATYGDVKFRIFWGKQNTEMSVEQWRRTLTGMEFSYNGNLEAGVWTDIALDLKPAEYNQLQYVECEIEVNTVRLQRSRILDNDNTLK